MGEPAVIDEDDFAITRGCNAASAALAPINFEKLRRERVDVFISAPRTGIWVSYKRFTPSEQGRAWYTEKLFLLDSNRTHFLRVI